MRPIQTRFRYAYTYRLKLAANRNSLTHYTKGTPSPHKRLRLLVGIRFQVSFTPLVGVLFTFPSRYLSSIGRTGYLALGGGPPGFPQDSTCPVVLGCSRKSLDFSPTGVLPPLPGLSRPLRLSLLLLLYGSPATPSTLSSAGFGLAPLRSPLLRGSIFLSLPPATKMFQFAGCPPHAYVFSVR